jgi:outer membrane receptor protein involved in Fe transport
VKTTFRRALTVAAFFAVSGSLGTIVGEDAARAATLDPQLTGNVAGSVTSSDGVPIHNAVVSLQGAVTSPMGRTDSAGHFRIPGLPAGTYAIRVSAVGFNPLGPRPVGVQKRETTDIALALARSSSSLVTIGRVQAGGGEAVSTSSAPVDAVNPQAYAAEGYARISDVLQDDMSTTLVHPTRGGSTILPTSVALRGPDPTETLVDIDGHQVNSGNSGDFDLSLLDPADYAGIELVKGISPSSLVGPDTIDGAINIRTLEPTVAPHGFLRLSAGSFNSFGQTIQSTGTQGRLGYALSLHSTTTNGDVNGPIFDSNTGQRADVGSSVDGKTVLGKLRYAFGNRGGGYAELSFHDQSTMRDISAALSAYPDPAVSGPPDLPVVAGFEGSTLQSHNAGYGLDVRVPVGPADGAGTAPASVLFRHYTSVVSQSVFGSAAGTSPYLYNDRDLSGENSLEFDEEFSNAGLTLQYSIRNEDLAIDGYTSGSSDTGDINLESIVRQFAVPSLLERRRASALYILRSALADPVAASSGASTTLLGQTQRAAVLRYTYDPTAKLHLTAAAYYSTYSSFGRYTDPRFGFVYTPNARSAIRFSVGTTYQAPQLPELYVPSVLPAAVNGVITTGNSALQPDHATEYGLGASHVFETGPHRTEASVDLYRVNVRTPAVTFVQAGNPDTNCGAVAAGGDGTPCLLSYAANAGDAIYQGVELSAQRRLTPALAVRAGYAVRSAFLTSIPPFLQDGTAVLNQQILGLPLQKASLSIAAAPPRGITFRTAFVYEGKYNELNRPPFATVAASVGYRWPAFELIVSGTNLTNVYAGHFTQTGAGVPQTIVGSTQPTDAYALQGAAFSLSLARRF